MKRMQTKYRKTNIDSLQAQTDYARNDGGQGVRDVSHDVPSYILEDLAVNYYKAYINVSPSRIIEIESSTQTQGTADMELKLWKAEHRTRVAASICRKIAKRRCSTKVTGIVKTHQYSTFQGNVATQYGIQQATATELQYLMRKHLASPNITVQRSGLVIHPSHNQLGASPDGQVHDPTSPNLEEIVEYRNPYSVRLLSLKEAALQKNLFADAKRWVTNVIIITIKPQHE